jgi:hypothetical protein
LQQSFAAFFMLPDFLLQFPVSAAIMLPDSELNKKLKSAQESTIIVVGPWFTSNAPLTNL